MLLWVRCCWGSVLPFYLRDEGRSSCSTDLASVDENGSSLDTMYMKSLPLEATCISRKHSRVRGGTTNHRVPSGWRVASSGEPHAKHDRAGVPRDFQ